MVQQNMCMIRQMRLFFGWCFIFDANECIFYMVFSNHIIENRWASNHICTVHSTLHNIIKYNVFSFSMFSSFCFLSVLILSFCYCTPLFRLSSMFPFFLIYFLFAVLSFFLPVLFLSLSSLSSYFPFLLLVLFSPPYPSFSPHHRPPFMYYRYKLTSSPYYVITLNWFFYAVYLIKVV